jgi:hypothetical protein
MNFIQPILGFLLMYVAIVIATLCIKLVNNENFNIFTLI